MPMSPRLLRPRVGGVFTPRSLAGLAAWFDADDASTITLNGSTVSEWRDKSGNNRHATQSTAANQPAYTTNSLNGKPALTALGEPFGNKSMSVAAWPYSAGNTALFVFRASGLNQTIYQRGNVNDTPSARVQDVSGLALRAIRGGASLAQTASNIAYTANAWSIGGTLINTALGRVFLNGVYGADTTDSQTWSGNYALRMFSVTNTQQTINGGIAEFIYYDRQLTASEVTQVAKYLAAKWGVSLAPQVSNAEAQDWVNRVYSNGGTVSTATAAAVNTFCESIASAGIRDRFYRLNLFAGSNLSAALVPLYRGPSLGGTQFGNTTDTNNGPFVSGDYAEATGLQGNGTSKYLNTGLPMNFTGARDYHMAAFAYTATGNCNLLGADTNGDGTSPRTYQGLSSFNATPRQWVWYSINSTFTQVTASSNSYAPALFVGVGGSSANNLYVGGSSVASAGASTNETCTQTYPVFVFASNRRNTLIDSISNARLGSYSAGLAMTASQVSAYNTAISAFNTALSRS